jgi:hypothetical protein
MTAATSSVSDLAAFNRPTPVLEVLPDITKNFRLSAAVTICSLGTSAMWVKSRKVGPGKCQQRWDDGPLAMREREAQRQALNSPLM